MDLESIMKVIIPAAGESTRLPNKLITPFYENGPLMIDYAIREARDAGIENIQVITRGADTSYFNELNEHLREQKVSLGYQDFPKGLGHAIGCGEEFANGEPILVILPDDITLPSASSYLLDLFNKYKSTIIGCEKLEQEDLSKDKLKKGRVPYGVIIPEKEVENGVYSIKELIEKPFPEEIQQFSELFKISGRYTFTNNIFNEIKNTKPKAEGEIQITDAIKRLNNKEKIFLLDYATRGIKRYDAGNPKGFEKTRKAVISFERNE